MDLRAAIQEAGGLLTLSDMARRWHISRARAGQLAASDDFPAPLGSKIGNSDVWIGNEVDSWRETPRRRNRPKGASLT